jgi:putative NADH-flavin reductase
MSVLTQAAQAANTAASTRIPMRLAILGATGRTGQALVDQALERGHQITAFVRSPQKLGAPRQGVAVRQGDPRKVAELIAALSGHDAVISALGLPGLGPATVLSECAHSTVSAMQSLGVTRLLVVSAAVLFDDGLLQAIARRTFLRNVAADSVEMERVVMASGLDWTIVRPPRLTTGPLTGRYLVEDGRMPRGRLSVSRADVADFLLNEVARGAHRRQIVGMAGGRR